MKNEIVRCRCVDMSVEGQGIARAGELVVFVKGLIKGEEADVKIIAEKKNYAVGIIDKLIVPSEHRITSDCAIAYKCGGCDYRHIEYDHQLQLKKEVLVNTFKNCEVKDITPCEERTYYRNKVQIPVRDHKMGFYRKYSNDIVEFDDCLIESKIANQIIADMKKLLIGKPCEEKIRHIIVKHGKGSGEVMVAFIVKDMHIDLSEALAYLKDHYPQITSIIMNLNDTDSNVILGSDEKVLYGRDHIYDNYDGIKVKLSLKSFYQVNHEMMLRLYKRVSELADLRKDSKVLDLYCGIGTISLYLSRHCGHVTGVEIVEAAVRNARDNAEMNGFVNTDFILADASKNMDEYLLDKDVVIVDPPRKGISKELISSFIGKRVKKIIYVSCNPATLARDLELLKDHYHISAIEPFDMFPYTIHSECLCVLDQKESS
ncbi:MAG: 23S rRNA (uracil(1939)-C(5))-methyltransferase RlmD [Erysipelotrichaceae bacterium]|nr:23S rRNA (uracil(1939)-C(5))-methyltransferase RlmD [Erysipelotrichaceae bacterium]